MHDVRRVSAFWIGRKQTQRRGWVECGTSASRRVADFHFLSRVCENSEAVEGSSRERSEQ